MNDLLICTVPYLEIYLPPAAPATLKGHLETKGFKVANLDLNIIVSELGFGAEIYNSLCVFFSSNFNNSSTEQLSVQEKDALTQVLDVWVDRIQSIDTKLLGLSVFSNNSRVATMLLVKRLKQINYPNKIVLGGQGVDEQWIITVKQYIDYWIIGEGEYALESLLNGIVDYPGINGKTNIQIDNLDTLGPADYSDYALSKYVFYDKSTVQITGSRGCVRKCTYCDVYQKWPKFRWRSGKIIADEIIKIHQTQGVNNFFFTDSLINGNMKSFVEMCTIIAEYRKKYAPELTWGGQFIARKIKSLPDNYFHLLADSGAFNLTIGVETGSDSVRNHMKKGFSNEDLDYHMEQFSNLGITCGFLMLIGYPTETKKDFEDTLRMLQRYQGYAANGTILGITLGQTLEIAENVPLTEMYKDILFQIPDEGINAIAWKPKKPNATLTLDERVRRRLVAGIVAQSYGWKLISADRELQYLKAAYEQS